MKSYKTFSAAILVALSLYPPWAAADGQSHTDPQTNTDAQTSGDTQTDTDTPGDNEAQAGTNGQTNTDLFRARINLICTTVDAEGNLIHDRIITSEFVEECALAMGVTDSSDLALAYNRSTDSLEVVNRTTREVICAPLSFGVGTALTNANETRVLVHNFVFLNTDTVASGLLSATQRLAFADSGELRSFGMRGSIFYSFTDGTNSATICRGGIAVGSMISQRGNQDRDDDNDDDNNGNQGQGNNQNQGNNNRNNRNNNNANQGLGNTNVNQGGFGSTNVNQGGFGITNNPVIITNNPNQGFTANQGFSTGLSQGLIANQGLGTGVPSLPNTGTGITGVNQGFGTTVGTGINQ